MISTKASVINKLLIYFFGGTSMKFKYFLILSVIIVFGLSVSTTAQSNTMTVEWHDAQGNLIVDALYNAVMGDTITGGARANENRIYQLKRGGYYWNTSTI